METVSVAELQYLGACEEAQEWLAKRFGTGDVPLADVLRAVALHRWGVEWADWYEPHLPPTARSAWERSRQCAAEDYRKVCSAYEQGAVSYRDLVEAATAYRAAARQAIRAAAEALEEGAPAEGGCRV